MNRRQLFRHATRLASAIVFTGAGWLMGTRALTMPPPGYVQCTCQDRVYNGITCIGGQTYRWYTDYDCYNHAVCGDEFEYVGDVCLMN